jgi:RNA polymerase sigma factor (sigma-70 family)
MPRAELEQRFTEILSAYGPALGRLASSYARGSGEHEDLLQEIAIAIWRALPTFRGECSERTFIYRIAHNRALTHLARRGPATESVDEGAAYADALANPEQLLSAAQRRQRLLAAIRRLPVAYAQVVTLTLEELSYAEIAAVLGISESNVGARLSRARALLRQDLGGTDGT